MEHNAGLLACHLLRGTEPMAGTSPAAAHRLDNEASDKLSHRPGMGPARTWSEVLDMEVVVGHLQGIRGLPEKQTCVKARIGHWEVSESSPCLQAQGWLSQPSCRAHTCFLGTDRQRGPFQKSVLGP